MVTSSHTGRIPLMLGIPRLQMLRASHAAAIYIHHDNILKITLETGDIMHALT